MPWSEEALKKTYIRWLQRCVIHLREYYAAEITYPSNPEDFSDETDGITLSFNKIDYQIFINNKTMHDLWDFELSYKKGRTPRFFQGVHKYISYLFESNLLKN